MSARKIMNRSIILTLIMTLLMSMSTVAMAAENSSPVPAEDSEVWNMNMDINDEDYEVEKPNTDPGVAQPMKDGYYIWKVTKKEVVGHPYGAWRNGPSGAGPANLTLNNSSGVNLSVSNTISGSYTSKGAIASSLGVTIGVSKTYSASYSVKVPSGKRYQIKYRPQYRKVKVVQTKYYRLDGTNHKTSDTKTSYVKIFENWDYKWVEL